MPIAFDGQPPSTPASAPVAPPPSMEDRSEQALRSDISDFDTLNSAELGALFNFDEPGLGGIVDPSSPSANEMDRLTPPSQQPPVDGSPAPVPGSPDDPHRYIPPAPELSSQPEDAPPAPVSPEAHSSPASLTPEEVQNLLAVKARMETDDFRNAEVIASEFIRDPVGTVTTYFPEVEQAIARRYEVAQADDPRTFAQKYADSELQKKYGEDFVFDPADANYRGTRSYEYRNDEIFYLNEGVQAYHQTKQQEAYRAQQEQRAMMQAAEGAFIKAGVSQPEVAAVLEKMKAIPNTPEHYFAMLAAYARELGYISGSNPPQPSAPPVAQRQPTTDSLPPAGVNTIPGSTGVAGGVMAQRARELLDTFPADLLKEDLL